MENNSSNFIQALNLDNHPMRRFMSRFKMQYYIGLEYLVRLCDDNYEYTNARLKQYQAKLLGNATIPNLNEKERQDIIYSLLNNRFRPWRKKYLHWLMCDMALIYFDEDQIKRTGIFLKEYINKGQVLEVDLIQSSLFNNEEIPKRVMHAKQLIEQFRTNRDFATQEEKRYIVTANVSAGKSTLINAITGKPLTRISQEICTGNLCYIYNKPYEDDVVHLSASPLNLNASYHELANVERSVVSSIASYFRMIPSSERICIIDTPGVNSAINRDHRKITRKALKEELYSKLIYVLNANKLGTDEEKDHLQWIAENVSRKKVVFVLNKLDTFKRMDDSIEKTIEGVKNDLLSLGYPEPIICPISSHFAYLIKLKENGEQMSEDEVDECNYYYKKFSKKEFDLSTYSRIVDNNINESELVQMKKQCGLYGLEQVLFGGESL